MKKNIKYKIFLCVFIIAAVLSNTVFISGCGIITKSSGFDSEEGMTLSSGNDPGRNGVYTDGVQPAESSESFETSENSETPPAVSDTAAAVSSAAAASAPVNTACGNVPDGTVKLSFVAAGDNIIHSTLIDDAKARAKSGENFDFTDMYSGVAGIIKSADVAFVNEETPIAGDEYDYTGYPNFNTPKEDAFALMDTGFDVINLANNHMLDKWEQGYINSINFWDAQKNYNGGNILAIGGFKDANDFENIRIYNKNGVSIAFLSYTYGTNGMTLPAGSKMVVPIIDDATVERQVKAARPLADLLFVVMHWGTEDSFTPDTWQRSLAQMMTDNGVDVILGMHPHVIQEIKWVGRPDGGKTLIAYSIGNFISGMLYGRNMLGGILGFDIVKTTKDGKSSAIVENAKFTPVVTHYTSGFKNFQIYKLEDYTDALASVHGCRKKYTPEFSVAYLKDLVVKNIAPEFLSDFYKQQ